MTRLLFSRTHAGLQRIAPAPALKPRETDHHPAKSKKYPAGFLAHAAPTHSSSPDTRRSCSPPNPWSDVSDPTTAPKPAPLRPRRRDGTTPRRSPRATTNAARLPEIPFRYPHRPPNAPHNSTTRSGDAPSATTPPPRADKSTGDLNHNAATPPPQTSNPPPSTVNFALQTSAASPRSIAPATTPRARAAPPTAPDSAPDSLGKIAAPRTPATGTLPPITNPSIHQSIARSRAVGGQSALESIRRWFSPHLVLAARADSRRCACPTPRWAPRRPQRATAPKPRARYYGSPAPSRTTPVLQAASRATCPWRFPRARPAPLGSRPFCGGSTSSTAPAHRTPAPEATSFNVSPPPSRRRYGADIHQVSGER